MAWLCTWRDMILQAIHVKSNIILKDCQFKGPGLVSNQSWEYCHNDGHVESHPIVVPILRDWVLPGILYTLIGSRGQRRYHPKNKLKVDVLRFDRFGRTSSTLQSSWSTTCNLPFSSEPNIYVVLATDPSQTITCPTRPHLRSLYDMPPSQGYCLPLFFKRREKSNHTFQKNEALGHQIHKACTLQRCATQTSKLQNPSLPPLRSHGRPAIRKKDTSTQRGKRKEEYLSEHRNIWSDAFSLFLFPKAEFQKYENKR